MTLNVNEFISFVLSKRKIFNLVRSINISVKNNRLLNYNFQDIVKYIPLKITITDFQTEIIRTFRTIREMFKFLSNSKDFRITQIEII